MATVVHVPPDPRDRALGRGIREIGSAIAGGITERRRKEARNEFLRALNESQDPVDGLSAIMEIAQDDPELARLGFEILDQKFPEQERVMLHTSEGETFETVRPKGSVFGEEELQRIAEERGVQRVSTQAPKTFFVQPEDGEPVRLPGAYFSSKEAREAQKAAGITGTLLSEDDVPKFEDLSTLQLKRKKEARAEREAKKKKPTQYEQELEAMMRRQGLDPDNQEDRDLAIIVKDTIEPTIQRYENYFADTMGEGFKVFKEGAEARLIEATPLIEDAIWAGMSPGQTNQSVFLKQTFDLATGEPKRAGGGTNEQIRSKAAAEFENVLGVSPDLFKAALESQIDPRDPSRGITIDELVNLDIEFDSSKPDETIIDLHDTEGRYIGSYTIIGSNIYPIKKSSFLR